MSARCPIGPRLEHAQAVIRGICTQEGVRYDWVMSDKRWRELVNVRKLIAYVLTTGGYTTIEIGGVLGRDHSTVVTLLNGGKSRFRGLPPEEARRRRRQAIQDGRRRAEAERSAA